MSCRSAGACQFMFDMLAGVSRHGPAGGYIAAHGGSLDLQNQISHRCHSRSCAPPMASAASGIKIIIGQCMPCVTSWAFNHDTQAAQVEPL